MAIVAKKIVAPAPAPQINRPEIQPRPRVRLRLVPPPGTSPATARATQPDEEKVGYKNPPIHTRFKKGQSGNPKGRPRGAKGLKTIAREVLTQKVNVRTAAGTVRMSKMEALFHRNTEQGLAGNLRAIAQLMTFYQSAVPDEPMVAAGRAPQAPATIEEMDVHDRALMAELQALLLAASGSS